MSTNIKVCKKRHKELYIFITEHGGYMYNESSPESATYYNHNKTNIEKCLDEYSSNYKTRIYLGGNERIHRVKPVKIKK